MNTPIDAQLEQARSHFQLGRTAQENGRLEEAVTQFETCLELAPEHLPALSALLSLPDYEPSDALLTRAIEYAAHDDQRRPAGFGLCFALAWRFERRREFDTAFKYMEMANTRRARASKYEPQGVDEFFARYLEVFTRDFVRTHAVHGSDSDRPVFLFGMPRTGSALIELMLTRHPAVVAAGALPDLPRIAARLPAVMSAELNRPQPEFPLCLGNLSRIFVRAMSGDYEQALTRHAAAETRVIDKNPFNFLNAGLIAILFPRARIIHCRRSPLDVGMACYSANFELAQDFTTDFGHFAHYYGHYHRLMEHWRGELDLPILDIQYENLVADPAGSTRDLVAFCGLPWDEACKVQVSQPVSGPVERWRNFAKHIGPLERALRAQGVI